MSWSQHHRKNRHQFNICSQTKTCVGNVLYTVQKDSNKITIKPTKHKAIKQK